MAAGWKQSALVPQSLPFHWAHLLCPVLLVLLRHLLQGLRQTDELDGWTKGTCGAEATACTLSSPAAHNTVCTMLLGQHLPSKARVDQGVDGLRSSKRRRQWWVAKAAKRRAQATGSEDGPARLTCCPIVQLRLSCLQQSCAASKPGAPVLWGSVRLVRAGQALRACKRISYGHVVQTALCAACKRSERQGLGGAGQQRLRLRPRKCGCHP